MKHIVENRKYYYIASLTLMVIGLAVMLINVVSGNGAFNYDVEFVGGTSVSIDIGQDFVNEDIANLVSEITGQDSPRIQKVVGTNEAMIQTLSLEPETRVKLINAILDKYGLEQDAVLDVADVSATVSSEMQITAILAVLVSCVAMLIYVSLRFANFSTGASAILALLHDAVIMVLSYSVLRIPLNYSFIAAILTVLGYSINATIVIFDRMRENKKADKRIDKVELIDSSIMQTMTRSLYTSLTTLFTLVALYIFGVQSIKEFTLPIIIGIVCGTYSSVFLSGSFWYTIGNLTKKKA